MYVIYLYISVLALTIANRFTESLTTRMMNEQSE